MINDFYFNKSVKIIKIEYKRTKNYFYSKTSFKICINFLKKLGLILGRKCQNLPCREKIVH